MITLYHNPRCSKSREAFQALEERNENFEVRKYLENPLSLNELKELIKKLGISPIELVRIKENDWKENFEGKELTDEEVLEAMVRFPKLIERPIVMVDNKAAVGRPLENILKLL